MTFINQNPAAMAATLLFALAYSGASQAAGYCSAGTATEGIGASNMTFNAIVANDCYGVVSGNISGSGANAGAPILNAMNWGSGWTYLDSTDEAGATLMGLSFTVTATSGSSGSWTLTGIDVNGSSPLNFPTALDFAVGLKGGNEYALWAFDDAMVDGNDTGTFSIVFTNNGGNNPDLSHLIVFAREASVAAVPEAETYAMMLAGLGLVGFMVSRRRLA